LLILILLLIAAVFQSITSFLLQAANASTPSPLAPPLDIGLLTTYVCAAFLLIVLVVILVGALALAEVMSADRHSC